MTTRILERRMPATGAADILARCGSMVQPRLREVIDRLPPSLRTMACFSFGWCDREGKPTAGAGNGGKGVRQALVVLSAEAVGGSAETAMAGAVAVELVHVFSLLHDDIMDGDEKRRHQATLWKAYGTGPAMLTGDALFALAVETIANLRGDQAQAAMGYLAEALVDLMCGQAQDIEFETRPWTGNGAVGVAEYRTMADRKTGSLLRCAACLGAVLAGAPSDVVRSLALAGHHLGRVFQAVDDLLGIWGDPSITGKPVFSDLRRAKKTLPVLAALTSDNAAGRHLADLLSSYQGVDEDLLPTVANLIDEAGGRWITRQEAERNLNRALRILSDAPLAEPAAAELAMLARYLGHRSR